MRLILPGLVVALGILGSGADALAQVPFTNVNDPFFAYYSFYLPRQQAQALSPGPEATINAINANRQQYAATNRSDMFDPRAASSESYLDASDDLRPNAGVVRRSPSGSSARSRLGGNLNGLGPAGYYNTANSYHPGIRTGRGKNSNIAVHRSRTVGAGGFGGVGLPGIR